MEDTHPLPSLQCYGSRNYAAQVRTSQKMLIQQLRDLEKDGVVHRTVYAEVPPKVEYMLTKDGMALRPTLKALKSWAESRKIPSSMKKKPAS